MNKCDILASSLLDALEVLSNEFDSLGLSPLNITNGANSILLQLVDNSNLLIQQFRKNLAQSKDLNSTILSLQNKNVTLNKSADKLRQELYDKNREIDGLKNKLLANEQKIQNINKDVSELKQNIRTLQKQSQSKDNMYEHKVKKLENANTNLQDRSLKNIGRYRSEDDIISTELKKFKMKEEIYKETILKLENNNTALLEEILNLKEEIVCMIQKKS